MTHVYELRGEMLVGMGVLGGRGERGEKKNGTTVIAYSIKYS